MEVYSKIGQIHFQNQNIPKRLKFNPTDHCCNVSQLLEFTRINLSNNLIGIDFQDCQINCIIRSNKNCKVRIEEWSYFCNTSILTTNFIEKATNYSHTALLRRLSLWSDECINVLRQRDDAIEYSGSVVPNLPSILLRPERLSKRIVNPENHVRSSKVVGKS